MDYGCKVEYRQSDIYLTPPDHKNTLIWMHGLGDSAQGFLSMFDNPKISPCSKQTKVVLLTAPTQSVTINGGMKMPSWYDIRDFSFDKSKFAKAIDLDQVKKAQERVYKVIEEETELLKGKSENVFLGGFSQGGCMSLYCGLQYEKKLGGALAYSCFMFPDIKQSQANQSTPVLVYHGEEDQLIPFDSIKESYNALDKSKREVTMFVQAGLGHSFDDKAVSMFKQFMSKYEAK